MTQRLSVYTLKTVMTESYPDHILKEVDGRSATKACWQNNVGNFKKKPSEKRTHPVNMAEDDGDYGYEDDVNALDEDVPAETWYGDDGYADDDEDYDEDQVAHVDGEGWFMML